MASIQFDHVVILVPYQYLSHPPTWLTQAFQIGAGGRHADGRTENRLILLADGTYLELIAFVDDDPAKREGHRWDGAFGIIDYALTTPEPLDFEALQRRLEASDTGISYRPPQSGGRTKPDGTELKWQITVPAAIPSGELPFWCHDVTPRERRVPVTDENSRQPSGTVGVAGMRLHVSSDRAKRLQRALVAVADGKGDVGTPLGPPGGWRPSLEVEEGGPAKSHTLHLVLLCHGDTPADIDEKIGDSRIRISFKRRQT